MDQNTTDSLSSDRLTIEMPANLIAQIDAQVGSVFVDRAEFVRSAVRHYLEYIRETQGTAPSDIG